MSEKIKQWEYLVHNLGSVLKSPKEEELGELLDEWGEDGWELISAFRGENSNRLTLIAKRPLTTTSRRQRSIPD